MRETQSSFKFQTRVYTSGVVLMTGLHRKYRSDDYSSGKWQLGMGPDDGPSLPPRPPHSLPSTRPPLTRVPHYFVHYHETRLMHARSRCRGTEVQRARERARGQGRVPNELARDHIAV